ncbi:AI-2E family transporter [Methanotorris igneus]|uniref:AI-2E family transporter n=1 Tax=Methanotorris igneus (strain DSM 5666 / JCM 11834 / Kol 5) TaxID=880724 RepID=F6BCP0_METIK|nr:AI-2E family transporter [Methanotorris igneus]AEF96251.1 protein of unknown function UPF0118 [Methanotorris igneus Kol 5]
MSIEEFKLLKRIIAIAVFLSCFYMVWPFIDVLAFSCAFAYMTKPIYDRLLPYLGKSLSALVCLLLFTIPTVILMLVVLKEILLYVQTIDTNAITNNILILLNYFGINRTSVGEFNQLLVQAWEFIKPSIKSMINQISLLPHIVIKIVMIFFTTYYFLKDGYKLKDAILYHVPEEYQYKTKIFLEYLNESYKNLFIGNAFTSLIIGIIAGIGYYLIGVPNALFLAILTGLFALLPIVGGWTVYIPLTIYYIISEDYIKALEIFIFGAVFLSTLPDFVIRPFVVKKEADLHPVLILIAFLIGPLTLGIKGFALGPMIVGALNAIFATKIKRKVEI